MNRLGLEFPEIRRVRRDSRLNGFTQSFDSLEQVLFGSFCFQGNRSLSLNVGNGRIQSNLLTKLEVLPPNENFRIAQLSQLVEGGRVQAVGVKESRKRRA